MNIQSIIIAAIILVAVIFTVIHLVKNRGKCACSGCTGCCANCHGCSQGK